jgi:splicing suppressor protein 51
MNRTLKHLLPTSRQLLQTRTLAKLTTTRHVQRRLLTQSAIRPISFKGLFSAKQEVPEKTLILEQDDLFHVLSQSPLPAMRDRAAIINKYGVCPVCDTHHEKDDKKHPVFDCPDCGHPTHCCEEHYQQGKAAHQENCAILREMNQDDHDLRSGRPMREFEFPSKVYNLLQAFIF